MCDCLESNRSGIGVRGIGARGSCRFPVSATLLPLLHSFSNIVSLAQRRSFPQKSTTHLRPTSMSLVKTKFWANLEEKQTFTRCCDALGVYLSLNPSPFPRFQDPNNQKPTVSLSHAERSGLEHAGDNYLYLMVDYALEQLCPAEFRLSRWKVIRAAVTCNRVLGEFMVALKMHERTPDKTGGDAWETVWGAIVDELGFHWALRWVVRTFRPLIMVCVDVLSLTMKRKHSPGEHAPAAKRPRTDTDDDTPLCTTINARPSTPSEPEPTSKASLLDFLAVARSAVKITSPPSPDPALLPLQVGSQEAVPASAFKTTPPTPAPTPSTATVKPRAPLSALTVPMPARTQSGSVDSAKTARAKVEPVRRAQGKENEAASGSRDLARAHNVGSGRLLDRLAPHQSHPQHDRDRATGRADCAQDGPRFESYEDRHGQADRRRADGYGGQARRRFERYDGDDGGDRGYDRRARFGQGRERDDERRARYDLEHREDHRRRR
ncbi:hypothetical protein C8R47DRAFT_478583 [Mycena vitilis]|nr:hypothetical protein C8R47DRAFT_478583 [Mycena vitilis]